VWRDIDLFFLKKDVLMIIQEDLKESLKSRFFSVSRETKQISVSRETLILKGACLFLTNG